MVVRGEETEEAPAVRHTAYLSGVPAAVTSEQIMAAFGADANAVRIATDFETQAPKGFAYIDFATRAGKDRRIRSGPAHRSCLLAHAPTGMCAALDDACAKASMDVEGHTIGVRVYAPHDDLPSQKTLYVSNIAPDVPEAELTELFASCGGMKEARLALARSAPEHAHPLGTGAVAGPVSL